MSLYEERKAEAREERNKNENIETRKSAKTLREIFYTDKDFPFIVILLF